MAKPPTLVRDNDGNLKVAASFASGRYQFTLDLAAERLFREWGYDEGEAVPLELFRSLVYAGDAWLPGSPDTPVEAGDDLVDPRRPDGMTDDEARALADHLRGRRFENGQRSALRDQIDRTPLGWHLTVAELRRTEDGVNGPSVDTGDNQLDTSDDEPVQATRSTVEDASLSYLAELEAAPSPVFEAFSTEDLADAYALFSGLKSRTESLRKAVRDELKDRIDDGQEVSGRFGTVSGHRTTRRSLKDDEVVLAAVERYGYPRKTVLTEQLDTTELEAFIERVDADELAFYELEASRSVRRTALDIEAIERRTAMDGDPADVD